MSGIAQDAVVLRRAQPWLGTLVAVEIVAARDVDGGAACAAAFDAVARVQHAMSPREAGSDVARFNAAPAGARIACDPWTVSVLRWAARLRQLTHGAFDVTLGTSAAPAWNVLGPRTIEKCAAAQIDLGGIAKGYAVDRAVATLRARGVRAGLVNAGGDLRAFGRRAWPVFARGLGGESVLALQLEAGAVATSAWRDGVSPHKRDPLVEPRHARAVPHDRAVTVLAPRCVVADALTKVVALSGDPAHRAVRETGAQAWLH